MEWDRARTLMMTIYNSSDKVKHPIRDRKQIMELPMIDGRVEIVENFQPDHTKEEYLEIVKKRLLKNG